MKKYLPVIAVFCLGICLTIGITDCSSKHDVIKTVLDKDAKTGEVDVSTIDRCYTSLKNKCNNMRSIDLSNCPPKFQAAYIAHISAWEQQNKVAGEIKAFDDRYNSVNGAFEAFIRGLVFDFGILGESNTAWQTIGEHQKQASQAISSTWHEVLRIAAEYDVDVSKYK